MWSDSYRSDLTSLPRKPIKLPPAVARRFVEDMRAFFAAGHNAIKADEIAARQLHALRESGRRGV